MKGIIYKATNTLDGRVYVGQTTQTLEKRRTEHLSLARRTREEYRTEFGKALVGHEGDFKWEVIEEVEGIEGREDWQTRLNLKKQLRDAERAWIDRLRSYDSRYGYNDSRGRMDKITAKTTNNRNSVAPVYNISTRKLVRVFPTMTLAMERYGTALYNTMVSPYRPGYGAAEWSKHKYIVVKPKPGEDIPKMLPFDVDEVIPKKEKVEPLFWLKHRVWPF